MTGLEKGLDRELIEAHEGLAATLHQHCFGDAHDSLRAGHALVFLQELGPIPGAQPTDAKAMIHQVERARRKIEHAQGIHHVELDPITNLIYIGLCARISYHRMTDIYSHQAGNAGIGLRKFNQPTAGATAHIEDLAEASRIWLLRQYPSHRGSAQAVLDEQSLHLCYTGTILHKIRARLL